MGMGRGSRVYGLDSYLAQRLRHPPPRADWFPSLFGRCRFAHARAIRTRKRAHGRKVAQARRRRRVCASRPAAAPPLAIPDVAVPTAARKLVGRRSISSWTLVTRYSLGTSIICDSSADAVCRSPPIDARSQNRPSRVLFPAAVCVNSNFYQ